MPAASTAERLISADDHVDVSHDLVKEHLASKFHSDYDAGLGRFRASMGSTASVAANTQWREQQGLEPDPNAGMGKNRRHEASGRPGHSDAVSRLADMDDDGVEASVNYCEVSSFRYLYLIEDGWREATRAFNETLGDFAAADPKRLIVSYQIPIHDIDAAVAEVQWAASVGCKSLQLPVYPAELGVPDYWDERYAPLFAAIQETDLPICCHIGLNTNLDDLMWRDPTPNKGVMVPVTGLMTAEAFGMWIMGGALEKFPKLKLVFVEPGLAWVVWWVHIVDDMKLRQGYQYPAISELPSYYFHRNVHLTFIEEEIAIQRLRDLLGVENIMWSSDFPHPVTSWPNSRKIIDEQLAGIPDDERELIVCGNAARVWNL